MSQEQPLDNLVLNKLDELYLTIDTLTEQELDKIIKYIEDQRLIVNVLERRKSALTNELRIERIKMRKELNSMKSEFKKSLLDTKKKKVEIESEESIEDDQARVVKKSTKKK
jgi:hypothetical protein